MSTLYIIGIGDSKANGLGGTYDRLGLPNPVAPGVLGAGYTTVVPTAALSGGDGAGGHYTAYVLTGPSAGQVTLFPDVSGTNYVDRTNVPTLTLSGGSPSTAANFLPVYAGGYFTQIERQLIAAGYDVKVINVARGGSQIANLIPGSNWQSDAGVAVANRFGAANCLIYFSTGINDAASGIAASAWATQAAALLSGYTTLGVKVVADRSCGIETSAATGFTSAQVTANNALMTQYNASLDTLQTNNPSTFHIITDEQTLMSGHPEYFGTSANGGAGPSTGIHQNDAGNLVIANDAVPKLAAYIRANFAASAPAPVVPAAPASLAAAAPVASVVLTWPAAANATNYRVRKDGVTTPIYDGPLLTFTDTFASGTSHTYTVTAYNVTGESSQTAPVTVTTITAGLTLTETDVTGGRLLNWTPVAGATNGYAVVWFSKMALPAAGDIGTVVARIAAGTTTWTDTSGYRNSLSTGSRYNVVALF